MSQTPNTVIGIDLGKNSFHVVGHDARGAIVLRQKWSRDQVEARLANIPHCLIGMEACVGAHHLSRKLASLGHDARSMPAKYVRPYGEGQKNDFNDAEAIAEVVHRPTMKFVATKIAEQLDLQALQRVRERMLLQRTARGHNGIGANPPAQSGPNNNAINKRSVLSWRASFDTLQPALRPSHRAARPVGVECSAPPITIESSRRTQLRRFHAATFLRPLPQRFHERNFRLKFGQQKVLENGFFQGLDVWLRG
jgi:hypothetical protein